MEAPCEPSSCSLAVSMKEAGEGDFLARQLGNGTNESLQALLQSLSRERADGLAGDTSAVLRIAISSVYSVVCALGLVGNLLVLYLMKSKQGWKKSPLNLFVTSLALTDLQFVLTLPFWAVENALDFTWLFGKAMCKIVAYVTATNMYASVFFLTAMSVARYHSVASALSSRRPGRGWGGGCCCQAKWLCLLIWGAAMLASLPHAVFSTTATVFGEELCLVRFPEGRGKSAQFWLGLYQSQKVLLGFVGPLAVISLCYLLLLRFLGERPAAGGPTRRAQVTRSVTVVVLSFFLCWLPNQALTAWGVLVKLNVVPFGPHYFLSQAYLFPVSVCLAHCNSCLNPLLYCLLRREFRAALRRLLWRLASPSLTATRPFTATTKPEPEEQALRALLPASPLPPPTGPPPPPPPELLYYPPGVVVGSGRWDLLPSSSAEQRC
ncbi:relaxin-3 receptor 1 [Emydura macquarii macquarii]|uniref:relaxin-3 receptor 1 n=1 Tax=Emydura macquarii macquarii TaxID=1129001 RepID=UPI00352A12D0